MPPKTRKVQLAVARNSKALKKNATLLIANCDENKLSDCHDLDDDWHNDEFENLKQISQTAFDIMIENAKVPTSFINKRPLARFLNEILELENWMPKPLNDNIMILEEPVLD
ncbi:10475_t:CDS:2, partial [Funneliformis caledonium]